MTNLLIRLLLITLAFYFVLPMIHGIQFHGNLYQAFIASLFFTVMGWVVELIAIALTAFLTITSLGLALLVLIPAWILGFWLLPAVALKVVADLLPGYFTVIGWMPAVLGGLVMFFIGIITSGTYHKYGNKNTDVSAA